MHCSSTTNVERTNSEAGWGAFHSGFVDDGMKDLTLVSFRYCPMMGSEVVSWVCQSWTVICCHTLGMSLQDSFVVAVFHHAI